MPRLLKRGQRLASLTPEEQEMLQRPWVHNFGPLGFYECPQSEFALEQQLERQGHIFRHVRDALMRCPANPRGLVCTVNDGYYGLYALQKGAGHVDIVDVGGHIPHREDWHMAQTEVAAKALHLADRCTISSRPFLDIEGRYDFGIFIGALPHFDDPDAVMAHWRRLVSYALVFQCNAAMMPLRMRDAKASKEAVDDFYYESPCEVVPWGSCFGRRKLIQIVVDAGWTIVNESQGLFPKGGIRFSRRENFLCV